MTATATVPWNPIDAAVNKATIAGQLTPGVCEITGANSPRKWDERGGYGYSGAIVVYHGTGLSHFTIGLTLYTIEDWNDWAKFKSVVAKAPFGKRPRALDISHPVLAEVGITSIVVEDVNAPMQIDDGVWLVEIKAIEYRNPKYTLAKPEGSAATPVDPREQEIAANSQEIDELSK